MTEIDKRNLKNMNVGISDIYHKCDKTNIWTEEANDRVKNSVVAGQT